MMLYIDDREKSPLCFALEDAALRQKISTVRKRLKVGDYVIGDVCFEVKEAQDFLQSILNKRLWNQIDNMDRNYQRNFLVIYGKRDGAIDNFIAYSKGKQTWNKEHWLRQKFIGAIGRIRLDYDIDLIWRDNIKNTIEEMLTIIKMASNDRKIIEPTVIKKVTTEDVRVDMLCTIKGISREKAKALLSRFGSIMEIGENIPKDIQQAKGIGKVTAEKMLLTLHSEKKVEQ